MLEVRDEAIAKRNPQDFLKADRWPNRVLQRTHRRENFIGAELHVRRDAGPASHDQLRRFTCRLPLLTRPAIGPGQLYRLDNQRGEVEGIDRRSCSVFWFLHHFKLTL
jgi:hypothetical protein